MFPLGGASIKGKRTDFASHHGVAGNLFAQLSFFLQSHIDAGIQGHFSHQQGDFDVFWVNGRKFLGDQSAFVGSAYQVDAVGVEEEFKVHLDIGDQQFACSEGCQMRADDEGVPMSAQQFAGQGSQICITLPTGGGGDIRIGGGGAHHFHHIQLIDPSLGD